MDRLLNKAMKHCDQAEVYMLEQTIDHIAFEDARLQDIDSQIQSGFSLRIMKDNVLGFAYTKNLGNRDELLKNALDSLKGNVQVDFSFPRTEKTKDFATYDPSIEHLTNGMIVTECNRITDYFKARTKGQINIDATRTQVKIRLLNSMGSDLSAKYSAYYVVPSLLFPNSYACIRRIYPYKTFVKTPDHYLDDIIDTYNRAFEIVSVPGGPMKVMFLPETLYSLMWRIQSGTSGRSVYENQSPLAKKIGKKICDSMLTIINDPLDDRYPNARAFDDEGTPCSRFPIIEKGVLKNFYCDLDYAGKMKKQPTGHGFKSGRMSGDAISLKPTPTLEHMCIHPGGDTFPELLARMNHGVIVANALGAHSGNILNGDFSIGLSPGLYVEKGRIIGRTREAMVAGNVYDLMSNIIAIENTTRPAFGGTFPSVLFDKASVATKS